MYTVDSSLRSSPIGTWQIWRDAIAPHNSEEAAEIAAHYFTMAPRFGLNADLALGQACEECTWFTDWKWRQNRNPAGIGSTSRDVPGAVFRSIEEGIRAHLEHLCCYVYTGETCPADHRALADPRHAFHDGLPAVRDLQRAERTWATAPGYAAAIVAIANEVTRKGDGMAAIPTSADIGYAVRWHAAADVGPARALADIRWFVVHDTEGRMAGDEATLTGSGSPVASALGLIDRDGSLVMMVPLDRTAWCCANQAVDKLAVNVELSGFSSAGYTDDQYRSLAALFRWVVAEGCPIPAIYIGKRSADGGPLPDDPGILGHQDVPDPNHAHQWGGEDHHQDPGPLFRWDYLLELIGGDVHPVQAAFAPGNTIGKIPMLHPFSSRWFALDAHGWALPQMGFPEKPEQTLPTGRRVQRFERGWYGTQAASDPWDVVAIPPEECAALGLPMG